MQIKCAICGKQKDVDEMHNYVCTECRYKKATELPPEFKNIFGGFHERTR